MLHHFPGCARGEQWKRDRNPKYGRWPRSRGSGQLDAATIALARVQKVFALIGGVLAAWLGGGVLSLGSLVGFVTVLGIAALIVIEC